MFVADFVDKMYFPEYAEKQLRASTVKGYKALWADHLKGRLQKIRLREFRTRDGELLLAAIARIGNSAVIP